VSQGIDLTSFGSSAGSLSTSSYTVVSLLFLFEIENLLRNPEFDPVENVFSRRRWKHPEACSVTNCKKASAHTYSHVNMIPHFSLHMEYSSLHQIVSLL
jgi:hypothetical protein